MRGTHLRWDRGVLFTSLAVSIAALTALGASAIPEVEILFAETGTNVITVGSGGDVAVGQPFTAQVWLTTDAAGVSSYGISIMFDDDLGNEIDLSPNAATPNIVELGAPPMDFNADAGVGGWQESDAAQAGLVRTFEALALISGPVSSTFLIGTVEFVAGSNVTSDGFDIFSGFFNDGVDGMFDNQFPGQPLDPVFGSAAVNFIPEPGTFFLLGSGTLGLALLRKRRA